MTNDHTPPETFIAVDLGSNALKYRRWQISGKQIELCDEQRHTIRIGTSVFNTGRLDPEAIARALESFKWVAGQARQYSAASVKAVGTSALRDAGNATELIKQVREKTGIALEVIDELEEARLVAAGALRRFPEMSEDYLIIDIGGGSTEFIRGKEDTILGARSLKLGAVRLTRTYFDALPPSPEAVGMLRQHIDEVLSTLPASISENATPLHCLAGGGTLTCLDKMIAASADLPTPAGQFSREALKALATRLLPLTPAQAIEQLHAEPARADIILAGSLLLEAIMERFSLRQVAVTASGLSDGLLGDFMRGAR